MHQNYSFLIIPILVIVVLLFVLPGHVGSIAPRDYGLREGDLIRAVEAADPDVFIVNQHGYKRLFLNPVIFGFYGHLGGFANVKTVSPQTRDAFKITGLVQNCESRDPKVYYVEETGFDTGVLHWAAISGNEATAGDPEFFKKVFCINNREFMWYPEGSAYTTLATIPQYQGSVTPKGLSVDIKLNNVDQPSTVAWNSTNTLSWTSQGAVRCQAPDYLVYQSPWFLYQSVPLSGSVSFHARSKLPFNHEVLSVWVECIDSDGNSTDDFVTVNINPETQPNITVTAPALGTIIPTAGTYTIKWSSNFSSPVRVLLQKADPTILTESQFWIIADQVPNTGTFLWDLTKKLPPDTQKGTTEDFTATPGTYAIFITDEYGAIVGSSPATFSIEALPSF